MKKRLRERVISARLTVRELKALDRLARRYGWKRGRLVRALVMEGLKRRDE